MSSLTRRTQILLDEDRYARLERRAAETGRSIAAVIREAIDRQLEDSGAAARRRQAVRGLLASPRPSYGAEPDWSEVKDDLRGRAG